MAELKRIEEERPTTELVSDDIPPKLPDGPKAGERPRAGNSG
jgi:hypothetical protein